VYLVVVCLPRKHQEKSEYSSSKWETIVLGDKKAPQKWGNSTSLEKIDDDIFFIAPISEHIYNPPPYKHRESIRDYVLVDIFYDALLCAVSREEQEKNTPSNHQKYPKEVYLYGWCDVKQRIHE